MNKIVSDTQPQPTKYNTITEGYLIIKSKAKKYWFVLGAKSLYFYKNKKVHPNFTS